MANCNSGNQTLDPYQSIIDSVNNNIKTLENQSNLIKPFVDLFSSTAIDTIPSPIGDVNSALSKFTADAICATSTDLEPINQLTSDCLNEASSAVRKYLNNIAGNIEDGIDLISDIVSLPEYTLMKLFQKIFGLTGNIKGLIGGIDSKIQCVSLSGSSSEYQSQIDDSTDRINSVLNDLKLSSDGSFDSDILLDGLDEDLKTNIKAYEERANSLETEIKTNISSTVDLAATVNPKRYF